MDWTKGLCSVLLAVLLSACAGHEGMQRVTLKEKSFYVELALDDATRQRGLMFRDSMPADQGMLFVFPRTEVQAFWMKNTQIPLDIMYFDSDRSFVSAAYRTPPCGEGDNCPNYPSDGRARYVLELNSGIGEALGLVRGDKIELPPDLPAPR
jgi:uncharacterized membrane protein (UPF0127 family)